MGELAQVPLYPEEVTPMVDYLHHLPSGGSGIANDNQNRVVNNL